jgi:DNA-binding NarL/FixJ family response regulator
MALRCLIVDDSEQFLRAARDLLEREGISVVGVASTGAAARRCCREMQPDVALIDIDLGEENGIDLARQLAAAGVARMILISAHSGDDVADVLAAGPSLPFLPKSALSAAAICRTLGVGAGG